MYYFKGYTHVHAYLNVAYDAEHPLSVGEALGDNPVAREGPAVKGLFERAMLASTDADFAYYPVESVAGRLRRGPVRSGDIFCLENWQDRILLVEARGADFSESLSAERRIAGNPLEAARTYRVATTAYTVAERAHEIARDGRFEALERGPLVREATLAYVRADGLQHGG